MGINFDKVPSYIRKEIDPPSAAVKRGSRGQTVKRIQEWLNFHDCRTSIDSDFGPATEDCVKDFQRKKRKSPTGKVDEATWKDLKALAEESHQSVSGLLTEAIRDYIKRKRVRPEVLNHLERSIADNEELGKLLAE